MADVGDRVDPDAHGGGCVCGSVRFRAAGAPLRVTLCHCLWCQRRTGTAFGTEVVFDASRVAFLGLYPSHYRHHSDESGRWLDMFFCPRCGTNLGFTLQAAPGIRTLPAGAFDDPGWVTPAQQEFRHVFVRTRRDWADLSQAAAVHERHFRG